MHVDRKCFLLGGFPLYFLISGCICRLQKKFGACKQRKLVSPWTFFFFFVFFTKLSSAKSDGRTCKLEMISTNFTPKFTKLHHDKSATFRAEIPGIIAFISHHERVLFPGFCPSAENMCNLLFQMNIAKNIAPANQPDWQKNFVVIKSSPFKRNKQRSRERNTRRTC